jgi:SnoaL-like domain
VWEQISLAAPWLYRLTARIVLRSLRVDSRVRRALLAASFRSGYGAFNRRDFDLMLLRYTPDCEFVTSSGLRSLGASGSIRSHDELRQFVEAIAEAWQGWELTPQAFIDLGDRVLWLGTQRAQGGSSRIPIEDPYAQLQDLHRGLIIRQQAFNDWDAALQAAGLRRDQVLGLQALATPARA